MSSGGRGEPQNEEQGEPRKGALLILMATLLLSILGTCKWGGPAPCPQCNSHCTLSAWPRLIVGLTDATAGRASAALAVQMTTEGRTGPILSAIDAGIEHDCHCLDHLADVACNYAYVMGADERDVTLYISRGEVGLGTCQVHLTEHNYCGFNATALEITVTDLDQVLCGSPRVLDICPG